MTTLEILKRGRERVAKGWCQHVGAKDANGAAVSYANPTACRWCSYGAIEQVGNACFALERVTKGCLVRWNDAPGRTQAEVVAAFDRAIELEEARTR